MRIVCLLPMGIERPSGRRYFHLARGMVAAGHQVRLLALHPDLPNCPERRFRQDGVEVWYVGQMHARKSSTVPGRFGALALIRVLIAATLGMLWGIICSPADVYHLGKPQPVNGLAAVIGVLMLRHKRFYVDCDDDEVGSNRLTSGWQRAVFGFWQNLLPRLARGLTVNTHFLAERFTNMSHKPISYVPNGVDLAAWQRPPEVTLQARRQGLGLAAQPVIAYAGTLALQNHPVNLLLDAFALLAPSLTTVQLLLIGGGEDLALLQQQAATLGIADRVHFTGQVAHSEVRDYLALATVSVDPVIDDAVARARSPLKIFESMALGVPVVTGDVGDRREVVGAAGLLVPPGDAAALATGLTTILTQPHVLNTLATAARSQAQQYDWSRLAEHWLQVYTPAPQVAPAPQRM